VDVRLAPGLSQRSIGLYDVRGNVVARLQPGTNDLRGLLPGTYFLRAAGVEGTAKVVLR
jgi:hypothetical protein